MPDAMKSVRIKISGRASSSLPDAPSSPLPAGEVEGEGASSTFTSLIGYAAFAAIAIGLLGYLALGAWHRR